MGRYSNTLIQRNREGRRYYAANRYVEIPRSNNDLYVITTDEDRYDLLANPEYIGSMYPPSGVQIRIPNNLAFVLNALNINE